MRCCRSFSSGSIRTWIPSPFTRKTSAASHSNCERNSSAWRVGRSSSPATIGFSNKPSPPFPISHLPSQPPPSSRTATLLLSCSVSRKVVVGGQSSAKSIPAQSRSGSLPGFTPNTTLVLNLLTPNFHLHPPCHLPSLLCPLPSALSHLHLLRGATGNPRPRSTGRIGGRNAP